MKKRLLVLFLAIASCISLAFGLTACGRGNESNPSGGETHTHTMTHHEKQAATCTEAGNVEYWSCSVCKKNFADKYGNKTLTSVTVKATGHSMTYHEEVEPGCTTAGNVEYWSCSGCSKNFADEKGARELTTVTVKATGHSMTYHEEVEPGCTTAGNVEYWSCSGCKKNYADKDGKIETTRLTIPAGHKIVTYPKKAPTCTEKGWTAYEACENCNYTTFRELPATGHAFSTEWSSDERYHWHAATCAHVSERKAQAAHAFGNWEIVENATTTKKGLRRRSCSTCNKTITEEIPKLIKYTANFYDGGYLLSITEFTSEDTSLAYVPTVNKTGYTFLGWYDALLGGKQYIDSKGILIDDWNPSRDIKLYAYWELKSYKIDYVCDGNVDLSGLPTQYTVEDSAIALPEQTRAGYVFSWEINSVPTTSIDTQEAKDLVVQGVWSRIEYSIQYRLNGGSAQNPVSFHIETETFTLNAPTKKGYTFSGWTGSNGETEQLSVEVPKGTVGNLSYTAHWSLNTYQIAYELRGGANNSSNPASYTIEGDDIILQDPVKEHYNFIRWERDNKPICEIVVSEAKDLTLTAIWEAVQYSISYNLNGGTATNPSTHTVESNAITLNNPKKNGYTFIGWTGSNGDTPQKVVIIPSRSAENLSYTANWELAIYQITYVLNGGTNAVKNPDSYTFVDTVELKDAVKTGYSFEGWFTDEEYNTRIESLYGQYGDLTLYANFVPFSYSSVFITGPYKVDLFYWEGSTENKVIELANGEQLDIYTLTEPTRNGYIFSGWYLDSDFSKLVTEDFIVQGDIKLYANWVKKKESWSIGINSSQTLKCSSSVDYPNEGSDSYNFYIPFSYSVTAQLEYSYNLEAIEDGYIVNPLLLFIDGCVIEHEIFDVTEGSKVTSTRADKTSSNAQHIIANQEYSGGRSIQLLPGHEYKMRCYVKSGVYNRPYSSVPVDASVYLKLNINVTKKSTFIQTPENYVVSQIYDEQATAPKVTKLGYDLVGWYDENDELMTDTWNYTSDKTFHAVWQMHDYKIRYNLNGGSPQAGNLTSYNLESADIVLQDPVKTGYTFGGWYKDSAFTQPITTIYGTDCCDYNLYAKWVANTYTATLNYNGGQNCPTIRFHSGGNVIKEHVLYKDSILRYFVPERLSENNIFGGWYIDEAFTQLFDFTGTINTDLNLYAKWIDVSDLVYCTLGSNTSVSINGNAYQYFAIVSPTVQTVTISSSSGLDLYGAVYDSAWNMLISCDDISDTNLDFSITVTLQAGQIYYIGYKANQAATIGTAVISVSGPDILKTYITGDYTEIINSIDVEYDTYYTLPTPHKEGYIFEGWYDENGRKVGTAFWKYNKNVTLYAHWSENRAL